MKCFLGVLPKDALPFDRLAERSRFLAVSVLHFSLTGGVGLCKGDALGEASLLLRRVGRAPWCALGESGGTQEEVALLRAYARYGHGCARRLASDVSFAVWDEKRGRLTLGGTGEGRAYVSEERDGLWFSSAAEVLFRPVAITLGVFSLLTKARG